MLGSGCPAGATGVGLWVDGWGKWCRALGGWIEHIGVGLWQAVKGKWGRAVAGWWGQVG